MKANHSMKPSLLPHHADRPFVTDDGRETTLVIHEKIEPPCSSEKAMNTIELTRTGTTTADSPAAPTTELKRLAIVIRDDAFDRLLTPLTFAWEMGRKGVQVDILFVLWAVRVLSRDGVQEIKIDPRYAHREAWLRERLQRDGDPLEIHDFLKLLKSTGNVRLHGCRLAAMTFDVSKDRLIPEADGIIDPGDFLREIAAHADHCQYF